MRILFLFVLLISVVFLRCQENPEKVAPPDPPVELAIRGADLSFLPEIEAYPTTYRDASGNAVDALDLLKAHGCNTIRIRLWHTPATAHSGLEEVIAFSERVRSKGMKVWLTVHYSDTWADPGHQTKPALWSALNLTDLSDSVYNYTKKIVLKLHPDIIQIGNEINDGFLWPDGQLSVNLPNFIALLKEGVQAVRDFSPTSNIMIHVAGHDNAAWFYQQLQDQNVSYDMIGLSYYPFWHGKDLNALKSNLNNLGFTFSKEVLIAETSYPFTLDWNDWTNNILGETNQLIPGYAATPEGQKQFLLSLKALIADTEKGTGFCYWAPEWVAFKGAESTTGSAWENMALFDFSNKALPALNAFE
ncbi:MAG: glycosyl hydrolase 53 family protein [Cyclobacteriaceae bacterium]